MNVRLHYFQDIMSPVSLCLLGAFVLAASHTLCEAVERSEVRDNGLVATYYYAQGSEPRPLVIMFGGSSGGNFYDTYQNYPEDLAAAGYAVLSLAYFDYDRNGDLPVKLRHIPLEYFKKAMDWVENQPLARKGQVAVIGNSRGGEAALLLAVQYPVISAVIASVPSAYVGGAYDNKRNVTGSAWTLDGKELPYVDYQKAVANYHPWWTIIYDDKEVQPFAIPVEEMHAAVLLLSGRQDRTWPSTEMCERIMQRLEKHRYPFAYQHIVYDAGHNIRVESWPDILSFLKEHYPEK